MNRRLVGGVAFGAAALLAVGARAQDAALALLSSTAVVYTGDGRPLFHGTADYIFRYARNADRRAYEWDPELSRVRISPDDGGPSAWLACDEIRTSGDRCGRPKHVVDPLIKLDSLMNRPPVRKRSGPLASLPTCPGDIRCP